MTRHGPLPQQFATVLQNNQAAVIVGTRSGGAGCGSLYANELVRLTHSGAQLSLPNCAQIRRDGSNEVSGVIPDVATGVRCNDGPAHAGRTTARRLPEALRQAEALAVASAPGD